MKTSQRNFDTTVDILVIGSGGGGMTAALAAKAAGLETLLVEKASVFGGTTALSGGGIWAPGADALLRDGYTGRPEEVLEYLETITAGLVTKERLQAYVDQTPKMIDFLEQLSGHIEFVWKPGYPDYYPDLPGGSALGCTVNVPPIDLRHLGEDEAALIKPLALAPRGIWLGPKELHDFYRIRQSWRGKAVLLRLAWRMLRARVTGERMVAIGQSLVARLFLAIREQGIDIWLNSPMVALVEDESGTVVGAEIEKDGHTVTVRARGGVVLATGGFDHDLPMRMQYEPVIDGDWSLGNPASTGDGIKAGEKIGAAVDLMDEAWWFPAIAWPDGRLQFMLNERMIPGQFVVNGAGKRFVNEAAPYTDFGHAVIAGQRTGVTHIPSWLIIDTRSWRRYVFAGHLPLPKIPGAPVPTGRKVPQAWLNSGVVKSGNTWTELAQEIGVPAEELQRTADRFNMMARNTIDEDFHRGESAYDNYYGDSTLPNPNLAVVDKAPFYAFRIVPGDLGTNGGLVTDEHARVLGRDGDVLRGLYATGNTAASVMGRSYAGAGATIGPAMTFGFIAAKHIGETIAAFDDDLANRAHSDAEAPTQ
ncbi:FAD-dependent oxidoreductase [Rhodococcus sp. USK10]|uniref:3-oxosteroid 1-dehydrogenase n=1 Tax=Rhodococcus wratislaviensis TaxID=44752 RepID=A0A402CMU0_RHOWR|nr:MULTISPECIES: FAD-binding protein [Rhodococcus]QYB04714.1 FAD-dependent oxidoreductase [Rhodococcus sp. USK10]GCE44819.1 3-oxosteroid 1-dehydrogenase [Rhodococcus wratislaviensis]